MDRSWSVHYHLHFDVDRVVYTQLKHFHMRVITTPSQRLGYIVTKHRTQDVNQRTLVDNYGAAMIVAEGIKKYEGCRVTVDRVSTIAWFPVPFLYCIEVNQTTPNMRKIETQMNAAIQGNANWSKANTTVTTTDGVSEVRLHGNLIAKVGDDFVTVFDGGWQSTTTKSRLNAIINEFCNAFTDGVFQKNYQWFVRDNKVTHDFVNGYTFCEFA